MVNGFIFVELFVCVFVDDGRFKVVEGNRWLVSCFILMKDVCVKNYIEKSKRYFVVWCVNGEKLVDLVVC